MLRSLFDSVTILLDDRAIHKKQLTNRGCSCSADLSTLSLIKVLTKTYIPIVADQEIALEIFDREAPCHKVVLPCEEYS